MGGWMGGWVVREKNVKIAFLTLWFGTELEMLRQELEAANAKKKDRWKKMILHPFPELNKNGKWGI